jgi:putative flippase GtrA
MYIITVNQSYFTMKFLVFRTDGNYFPEYPKTIATYIFVYFLNAGILYGFQQLNMNIYISQALALLIITVITYLLHKHINYTK